MIATRVKIAFSGLALVFVTLAIALKVVAYEDGGTYYHIHNLIVACIGFSWSFFAACWIVINYWLLKKDFRKLSLLVRLIIIVLTLVLILAICVVLLFSGYSLHSYLGGQKKYEAAMKQCGHPPILGDVPLAGEKIYHTPGSSEYERLKYWVGEDHIINLTPMKYFCTEQEAISQGYTKDQYQQ